MARCAREICRRWRPDALIRRGIGLRLDGRWYCSRACLQVMVQSRLERAARSDGPVPSTPPRVRIGALLMTGDSHVSPRAIAQALDAQRTTGRRLCAELLEMGAVSTDELQRALAKQSGTKYLTAIDPAVVASGHAGLARGMVEALGLVPFAGDADARLLKVAYVAPLSRVSLAALGELTGWRIEPYLVADGVWSSLIQSYGTKTTGAQVRSEKGTMAQALQHVTTAAERTSSARLLHARLDAHLWVRVEAAGDVQDLLMSVGQSEEDAKWQTAPTLH